MMIHPHRSHPKRSVPMTSNGKSESSLRAPPESAASECLLEAWREALAEVLDTQQRTWDRERALIEAQAAAVIANLRAEVAGLRAEVRDMVAAELLTATADGRFARSEDDLQGERDG